MYDSCSVCFKQRLKHMLTHEGVMSGTLTCVLECNLTVVAKLLGHVFTLDVHVVTS